MVAFAGWEMPVQYTGIVEEHLAVRGAAGLFDVSHMGEIEVSGPGALELCQKITANDVSRLSPLQAQYSLILNRDGGVVDDIMVYRVETDRFLLCVNAANRLKDAAWVEEHKEGRTEVRDESDGYVLLALQGPRAQEILQPLTAFPLADLNPFRFFRGEVAGTSCIVSRTGYTGEDGFEIYCDAGAGERLWNSLMDGGLGAGLKPAGLGARDTLRLERALALYGHELNEATSPLEAGLGWVTKLSKGEFVGRDALLAQKREGVRRRLVGLELVEPGIARSGYPITKEGRPLGEVTSGTLSPTLKKSIALGYVPVGEGDVGNTVEVVARRRAIKAKVVALPFYRR